MKKWSFAELLEEELVLFTCEWGRQNEWAPKISFLLSLHIRFTGSRCLDLIFIDFDSDIIPRLPIAPFWTFWTICVAFWDKLQTHTRFTLLGKCESNRSGFLTRHRRVYCRQIKGVNKERQRDILSRPHRECGLSRNSGGRDHGISTSINQSINQSWIPIGISPINIGRWLIRRPLSMDNRRSCGESLKIGRIHGIRCAFGKRLDGQTDGRSHPLIQMRRRI